MSGAVPEIDIDGDPTAVYRLFDANDMLLRVGITRHIPARFAQYKAEADWWPLVARKTMIWYGSRSEALAVEAAAILAEDPIHNIAGREPGVKRRTGGTGRDRHREMPLSIRFSHPLRADLQDAARLLRMPVHRIIRQAVKELLDASEAGTANREITEGLKAETTETEN